MRRMLYAASLMLIAVPAAQAIDRMPELNMEPSCRGAVASAAIVGRTEDACRRDESTARDHLDQQWTDFTVAQRQHCVRLTTLGGPPSYVELLTCLEMSKAAANLPKAGLYQPPAASTVTTGSR